MQKIDIDIFSIFVAAALQWVLAIFWYSPVFSKPFVKKNDLSFKSPRFHLMYFLLGIVIAFFLSIVEGFFGVMSTSDGIIIGLFTAVFFVGTTSMPSVIQNHIKWRDYFFHLGFWMVSFIVMGGILAV